MTFARRHIAPSGTSDWDNVLHNMPCWLWQTDADYCLTYVSEGFEWHTNFKRQDLMGVNILSDAYGAIQSQAGLGAYHDALRAHAPINGMVYEKLLINGDRTVFLDSAIPMQDHGGQFHGYRGITLHLSQAAIGAGPNFGAVADLKSRAASLEATIQERNKQLEYSNTIMAEILSAMSEGILVTSGDKIYDDDNRILFTNPAVLSQLGVEDMVVEPGTRFRELTDALIARGDLEGEEDDAFSKALGPEGKLTLDLQSLDRALAVKGAPLPGGGYVLVHSDITEQRKHTEMLEAARHAADQANSAKSAFLAAMSHEIRTPMNGILGMADILADAPLSDEQQECVDIIRNSALALSGLISDILDFSKIEAGHLELFSEPFSLPVLLRDIVALMRPMAEAKGLTFDLRVADVVPDVLEGDHARLRQVLVNLLGNAIKFTLKGDVELRITGRGPIAIQVRDSGIGIPSDKIDRIFAPFEQGQGGLQREFEGTGLGLAITHKLVTGMGGSIDVTSEVGRGTIFTVSLPLVSSDVTAGSLERDDITMVPNSCMGMRILVAEDNCTNQLIMRKMLERLGAEFTIVSDGIEAMEEVQAAQYDAIFMDLSMPRLDGLEATRQIREWERRMQTSPVSIFALTGNAFEKDQREAVAAGMDGFLSKPLRMNTLFETLAHHVRK
ncbi:MAG: ATP-binding protein [Marinovum sp.]|nr:ATP-binding protein [Marinovum sp.]